jgi:hypothetical protein
MWEYVRSRPLPKLPDLDSGQAEIFERRAIHFFGHCDHAERNRLIEAWSFFFNIGQCEIDSGSAARPKMFAICKRGRHTFATFFRSAVRQPKDCNGWVAAGAVNFYFSFARMHALNRNGRNFAQDGRLGCQRY